MKKKEDNKERVFTFPDNFKAFDNPALKMEREEFQEWLKNATMEEKMKFMDDFFNNNKTNEQ